MASGDFYPPSLWRDSPMFKAIKNALSVWVGNAPIVEASKTVDLSFLKDIQVNTNTHDLCELERQNFVLLFIYDEMMKGRLHNVLLGEGSFKIATAVTKDDFYLCKNTEGDSIRVIMLRHYPQSSKPVQGELWAIHPSSIITIDKYKVNGVQFKRNKIDVVIPYKKGKVAHKEFYKTVSVFAYIGRDSYWKDLIDGGYNYSPVRTFKHKDFIKGDYFFFTPLEYNDKV